MEETKSIQTFGNELQAVLGKMDIPCFLRNVEESIVANIYEFSINKLDKFKKLNNALDVINLLKKTQLRLGQSKNYDFAIYEDKQTQSIGLAANFESYSFANPYSALLGIDNSGELVGIDFTKATHTLISGSTGMGKTTLLNNIIYSLTKNSDDVSIHLIDVKRTLTIWNDCPQVKSVDCGEYPAYWRLYQIAQELDDRLESLSKQKLLKADEKTCPYIFVIIDELSDLMFSSIKKDIEELLVHIAQVGRAVNICLILATQNPLVSVCTSLIKANCPTRIALKAISQRDSINILGNKHSYELKGVGDCIIRPAYYPLEHSFKAFYIDDKEILEYIQAKKENTHATKKRK